MISYNVYQAERAFLRAAQRQHVDVGVERALVHEILEEAACLIDASIPDSFRRHIDARDVARVALMLAAREHREAIRTAIDELVDSLTR